jgi:hypothetical protein
MVPPDLEKMVLVPALTYTPPPQPFSALTLALFRSIALPFTISAPPETATRAAAAASNSRHSGYPNGGHV